MALLWQVSLGGGQTKGQGGMWDEAYLWGAGTPYQGGYSHDEASVETSLTGGGTGGFFSLTPKFVQLVELDLNAVGGLTQMAQ